MAGNNPTLLDVMKRTDPQGGITSMVEVLDRESPVLRTATFREGNLPTGHIFAARTALPSVHFRKFNQGIKSSKSKSDQVTETCGMIVGRSAVDRKLAKLNGNEGAFRASEDRAFMESFAQSFENSFFYSSTRTTPEQVMGMTPRLDSKSGIGSKQFHEFGTAGSNTNTSIWGVVWGEKAVYGITPKGQPSGLQHEDRGVLDVLDENGDPIPSLVSDWDWTYGFCVEDMRKIVRLGNINVNNLAGSEASDNLIPAMIKASYKLHNPGAGRLVWYCNRTVAMNLDLQARNAVKSGGQLKYETVDGQPKLFFRGAPIEISDAILDTEAAVV